MHEVSCAYVMCDPVIYVYAVCKERDSSNCSCTAICIQATEIRWKDCDNCRTQANGNLKV